jgi:hypothetical protein
LRTIIYSTLLLTALLFTPQMIDVRYGSSESLKFSHIFEKGVGSSTVLESVSLSSNTSSTQSTSQTQTTETAEEVVSSNNLSELKLVASEMRDNLKAAITTTAAVATGFVDLATAAVQVAISAVTLVFSVGKLGWLTLKTLYILGSIAAEGVDSM